MAIQILGIREYKDKKSGKLRKAHKFFDQKWRAPSIEHILKYPDEVLEQVPEKEQYNLYFTAADCHEDAPRNMAYQNIIPIDIDKIVSDPTDKDIEKYVAIICDCLNVDSKKVGIVFSGNGIQFYIGLKEPIKHASYFDKYRHLYKAMCGHINHTLYSYGISGEADTQVWSPARLLRMPNTKNIKKDKGIKHTYVINDTIERLDFNMAARIGLTEVEEGSYIHPKAAAKISVDTHAVQEGCLFLQHCRENQSDISEPEWYAMLSIVARLDNGTKLIHEYSKEHPQYDPADTDFKAQQALDASGPRTCKNISTMFSGCQQCDYFNVCRSPIAIKSEEFITTKDTGFYEMSIDRNGNEKLGKPNYDDLAKFFNQDNPYATLDPAGIVHVFDGKKWSDISRNKIHNFAELNFNPPPTHGMCQEFEAKLKRTKLQDQDWFQPEGKINFDNGVLDIHTNEFASHSPEYGFKYVLPFEYDPEADCPRFKQFLNEVTLEREDLINVLIEFMGYSIAGVDPNLGQKALILRGDGANGKSVFIEVLRSIAGQGNYSTLSMGAEVNRLENRYQLSGKLFNVSEETPTGAMVDSSVFKALVSGGEVQARKLYCDSFSMRNFAKIIMACNELPSTIDLSHGMFRRLLIVPFDATFEGEDRDIHIVEKLKSELSGIFNLCVEGYRRFMDNGRFSESNTIDYEKAKYRKDNDSVLNFVEENCIVNLDCRVPSSTLYSSYKFYCDESGFRAQNKTFFSRSIHKIVKEKLDIDDISTKVLVNGRRQRGLKGIGMLEGGTY